MSDPYGLTDAEYEEEVRCAALGLEGPNAKSYRAATWADAADTLRKARKENPMVCTVCGSVELKNAGDRTPGSPVSEYLRCDDCGTVF